MTLPRLTPHTTAVILFLGATLAILWDMLLPGYLFTLDMVWTDKPLWSWSTDGFNNAAPIRILLSILGILMPAWVVQKLMLIVFFFGLFYIPYRFLPFLTTHTSKLFAGFLYALNPFVYTRLLAGQWGVLLGYMCLPILIYSLVRLYEKRDHRSGLLFGGALSVVGIMSIHFLYLSIIMSLFFFLLVLIREGMRNTLPLIRAGAWGFALFLIVSSYWLVPAFTRETPLEERFTTAHFEGFAGSENHLIPAPLNLLVLGGFWGEGENWRYYFVWPQDELLFWIGAGMLGVLIILGSISMLRARETRQSALTILALGVTAYILAFGAWGGFGTSLNLWLYTHIPGWAGLRDSHKIAGVLALVYTLFASVGMARTLSYLESRVPRWAPLSVPLFFLIPILFGMHQFFGFQGQLVPTMYPDSWHTTRTLISEADEEGKMLILPWQGYFSLPFANQLITANPARAFFGQSYVVQGKTVGMEALYDQEADASYRAFDTFLHEVETLPVASLIETLRLHHIRYVFVVLNDAVSDQETWLLPERTSNKSDETDRTPVLDPKDTVVLSSLLRVPHELVLDSDVLLYRFTY